MHAPSLARIADLAIAPTGTTAAPTLPPHHPALIPRQMYVLPRLQQASANLPLELRYVTPRLLALTARRVPARAAPPAHRTFLRPIAARSALFLLKCSAR